MERRTAVRARHAALPWRDPHAASLRPDSQGSPAQACGLVALMGTVLTALLRVARAAVRLALGRSRGRGQGGRARTPVPPAGPSTEDLLRQGWTRPTPEHLVRPSYWPAVLAFALAFTFWGLVSSLVISGVGVALFALVLGNWIGELRHDVE